jgi:predicted restriction endonuclease
MKGLTTALGIISRQTTVGAQVYLERERGNPMSQLGKEHTQSRKMDAKFEYLKQEGCYIL